MQQAKYVRIFSDENGESHFEDLEMSLPPVDFAPPAAPLKIALLLPATQTLWLVVPAGWVGEEFHPSSRRQIFSLVQGKYEVTGMTVLCVTFRWAACCYSKIPLKGSLHPFH